MHRVTVTGRLSPGSSPASSCGFCHCARIRQSFRFRQGLARFRFFRAVISLSLPAIGILLLSHLTQFLPALETT